MSGMTAAFSTTFIPISIKQLGKMSLGVNSAGFFNKNTGTASLLLVNGLGCEGEIGA